MYGFVIGSGDNRQIIFSRGYKSLPYHHTGSLTKKSTDAILQYFVAIYGAHPIKSVFMEVLFC